MATTDAVLEPFIVRADRGYGDPLRQQETQGETEARAAVTGMMRQVQAASGGHRDIVVEAFSAATGRVLEAWRCRRKDGNGYLWEQEVIAGRHLVGADLPEVERMLRRAIYTANYGGEEDGDLFTFASGAGDLLQMGDVALAGHEHRMTELLGGKVQGPSIVRRWIGAAEGDRRGGRR
jgi:hypothetical protein